MRTFAIGDIHGDLPALEALLAKLPDLCETDTLVFLGDYLDRGPDSRGVVERVRNLHTQIPAQVIALRGNHEDAWLKVIDEGWPGFVLPRGNGCYACLFSYLGLPQDTELDDALFAALAAGSFFPPDVVEWMRSLPFWYEDAHAIYVHAGLARVEGRWLHPSEVTDTSVLLWTRSEDFFLEYDGKVTIVGHTGTTTLPEGRSLYTAEDGSDLYWAGQSAYCIDTGCGKKNGFLTGYQLPEHLVYESR